jgi:glucoamylase
MPPRWTHSNKQAVGTAYSSDSKLWFTLWNGILTEAFAPTIDRPQLRDMEFLVTDGATFFQEEKRHLVSKVERLTQHALGYRVSTADPEGRYTIHKEVITHPHLACVLERVRVDVVPAWRGKLHLYVICAPHLEVGGWGNTARRLPVAGRTVLTAEKDGLALALSPSVPFHKTSCGFVGRSDGWTDIADNFRMDWEFDTATDGNVALTGEIPFEAGREFVLALGFGRGLPNAITTLFQSLGTPYRTARSRFLEQWERADRHLLPLESASHDEGRLFHASYSLLLAHEDKTYPGATIASLSIPWGASKGDEDRGGYHLVWTRDLVHTATGLLAAGNRETPLRALVYLATRQQSDGGFPQNSWINGDAYWSGIQLDEVSYPILLAWRLARDRALEEFDPYPMVRAAGSYLIRHGPATQQERWEEAAGYSPSTLAVNIAALVGAGIMARAHKDAPTAQFLEEYADFLESRIAQWTVTTQGSLVPGVTRHFIRIRPAEPDDPTPVADANEGTLRIANQAPGAPSEFLARDIVDAGFLELVRYGIWKPLDPVVVDSVRVVDQCLRVETPFGPAWRRYNHDGYGQRPDGGPFEGWGQGRAWPLLTGERGHYELAAGRDPAPYLEALERFAKPGDILTEQVWDERDWPEQHLFLGRPTEAAMPLAWAHAEYLCLLRSAADRKVFDLIPEVAARYRSPHRHRPIDVWKHNHQVPQVTRGATLRILNRSPFRLHWSRDDWATTDDTPSRTTAVGVEFVDLIVPEDQRHPIRFTFYWPGTGQWEGHDYAVAPTSGVRLAH